MLITIVIFFVILSLLVLVHELGHFLVARKFGVKCEEFGLGFPPRIVGIVKKSWPEHLTDNFEKKKVYQILPKEVKGLINKIRQKIGLTKWVIIKGNGKKNQTAGCDKNSAGSQTDNFYKNTIYSLNYVPLGGFVKIKGEDGENRHDQDSFSGRPIWKRALIIASGVMMNFILAIFLLSIGFTFGIPQVLDDDLRASSVRIKSEQIQILSVIKDSPAEKSDLKAGDAIIDLDGYAFKNIAEIEDYISQSQANKISLKIRRGQQEYQKVAQPQIMNFGQEGSKRAIGISFAKTGIVSYPFYQAIWEGIVATLFLMKVIIVSFYDLFRDLIFTRHVTVDIAGPVGIAVVTGQVVKLGIIYIIQFAALLSINLGIINFLPFPALDGGRIIGLVIEALRRKPNNQRIEALIHNIGFVVLIILVILVTYRDLAKIGGGVFDKFFG